MKLVLALSFLVFLFVAAPQSARAQAGPAPDDSKDSVNLDRRRSRVKWKQREYLGLDRWSAIWMDSDRSGGTRPP